MKQINHNGLLFLTCFTALVVPALTLARLIILRDQTKTPARLASDIFTVLFTCSVVSNGGLLLANTVTEMMVKKNEAGNNDDKILEAMFTFFNLDGSVNLYKHDRIVKYLQRNFGESTLYTIEMWLLKGAYLSLYYDLVPQLTKKVRWMLYLTTLYTTCTLAVCLAIQFSICKPIDTNWNPNLDQYCTYVTNPLWINSISWINITTDILILIIPLFILSSLKLGGREKYALAFVFGLGFMSIVSSAVRFGVLNRMATLNATSLELIHATILWGTIECLMAHTAFCLPAFRVLIRSSGDQRKMDSMMNSGALASRTGTTTGGAKKDNYIRSSSVEDGLFTSKGKGFESNLEDGILVTNSLSITSRTESETELRTWEAGRWEDNETQGQEGIAR